MRKKNYIVVKVNLHSAKKLNLCRDIFQSANETSTFTTTWSLGASIYIEKALRKINRNRKLHGDYGEETGEKKKRIRPVPLGLGRNM